MNLNLPGYLNVVASGFKEYRNQTSAPDEAGFLDGGIKAIDGYLAYLAARDAAFSTAAKPPLAETFDHEEIVKIVDDEDEENQGCDFEPGAVVYLNSGGAAMTVESVDFSGDEIQVSCVWLDNDNKCHGREFALGVLKPEREV